MLDKSSDNHERPCAILVMDAVLVMRAPSAVDDGLDMCIQASTYHDPKVSQNNAELKTLLARLGGHQDFWNCECGARPGIETFQSGGL